MKIICLQENLKNNLNLVQNIVGKNLTLPILNNLLLQTENGKLKISATNLEIGINAWTAGKIEKEGAITCPAKIFYNFVNNLPNKKIEISAKDNNLIIKCENYKANLKGLPADDFPIIPKIKDTPLFEIESDKFKEALTQVVGMAALSESRPEISGILLKIEKNNLILAATDSFRLAEKTINDLMLNKKEQSLIIPQRTILELIRILEGKENLKVVLGNNQILFETSGTQLISRIIDGQYPDYQQIIPKNFATQVIIKKEEFLNSVRLASFFSSKINDIKLVFNSGKMEIISQSPDLGENRSLLTPNIKGKDLEISFNYKYILDGLNNIFSSDIFLGFNSSDQPMIMRSVEKNDYLYVVMPIKSV